MHYIHNANITSQKLKIFFFLFLYFQRWRDTVDIKYINKIKIYTTKGFKECDVEEWIFLTSLQYITCLR